MHPLSWGESSSVIGDVPHLTLVQLVEKQHLIPYNTRGISLLPFGGPSFGGLYLDYFHLNSISNLTEDLL
jgi:hypothetical protein